MNEMDIKERMDGMKGLYIKDGINGMKGLYIKGE